MFFTERFACNLDFINTKSSPEESYLIRPEDISWTRPGLQFGSLEYLVR